MVGAPRSGTSMTMGVLHRCGWWTGGVGMVGTRNPRGFYEHRALKEPVRRVLKAYGVDPMGQWPLRQIGEPCPQVVEEIEAAMRRLGWQGGAFAMKGIIALWLPSLVDALQCRVLRVWRPLAAVAQSIDAAGFHRGDPLQMARTYQDAMRRMQGLDIDAERVWSGDFGQMREAVEELGGTWSEEVTAWVDPKLRNYSATA